MSDIIIPRDTVNLSALDADLRAALDEGVSGVSFSRGILTIHLTEKASVNASDTARRIALNHDPAKLSADQQQTQAQAAKLDAARKATSGDLDTDKFADPLVNELARKVAWLEQEILALRAGR